MNEPSDTGSSIGAGRPANPAGAHQSSAPPSWIFLLLAMPYGIFNGGVAGTLLSFVLRRQGHAMFAIADEMAILGIPPVLYFLWSPLADFWIARRTWYLLAACLTAAGTAAAFFFPDLSRPVPEALLLAATVAVMMTSACFGGIAAALVPEQQKSRVSSMIQAGNLGGGALGSWGLVILAQQCSNSTLGVAGAAAVLLPALAVLAIHEPAPPQAAADAGPAPQLAVMWHEFKATFLCWRTWPSLLLVMSPLCSGGAVNLLPGIAVDYHVSGAGVAWLNGAAGALLTTAGAMLMALVPKRTDPRLTYAWFGLANAASIGVLCFGPIAPATYFAGNVLYLISVGGGYANFTAIVLQVVGDAGKSGSSRYAIVVGLGNLPVAYMAAVDGLGARWWGTRGFSGIDMALSALVAVLYLACYRIWIRPRWARHLESLEKGEAVLAD